MSYGLRDEPQGDEGERWFYGAVLPLPIAGLGFLWVVTRRADLHDPKSGIVLHGSDAVALGVTALCLALSLHFHFFWGLSQSPTLRRY